MNENLSEQTEKFEMFVGQNLDLTSEHFVRFLSSRLRSISIISQFLSIKVRFLFPLIHPYFLTRGHDGSDRKLTRKFISVLQYLRRLTCVETDLGHGQYKNNRQKFTRGVQWW